MVLLLLSLGSAWLLWKLSIPPLLILVAGCTVYIIYTFFGPEVPLWYLVQLVRLLYSICYHVSGSYFIRRILAIVVVGATVTVYCIWPYLYKSIREDRLLKLELQLRTVSHKLNELEQLIMRNHQEIIELLGEH